MNNTESQYEKSVQVNHLSYTLMGNKTYSLSNIKSNGHKFHFKSNSNLNESKNSKYTKHNVFSKINKYKFNNSVSKTKYSEQSKKNSDRNNIKSKVETNEHSYLDNVSDFINMKIIPENGNIKKSNINNNEQNKSKYKSNYSSNKIFYDTKNIFKPISQIFAPKNSLISNNKNTKSVNLPNINTKTAYESVYYFNNTNSIKKVESVYKTELRLRESINREIKSKKNLQLELFNGSKEFTLSNSLNELDMDVDRKEIKHMVSDLYNKFSKIKNVSSINNITPEELREFKKNYPKTLTTSKFFEVNSHVSFPHVINDKNIICSIYEDNVSNLKNLLNNKLDGKTIKINKNIF